MYILILSNLTYGRLKLKSHENQSSVKPTTMGKKIYLYIHICMYFRK